MGKEEGKKRSTGDDGRHQGTVVSLENKVPNPVAQETAIALVT